MSGTGVKTTSDHLVIGGKSFTSRLMVGTGKYKDFGVMREAIAASGAQIVTVSIRRVEIGAAGHQGILEAIDLSSMQLMPNTAGCKTTEEAVRVAKLALIHPPQLGPAPRIPQEARGDAPQGVAVDDGVAVGGVRLQVRSRGRGRPRRGQSQQENQRYNCFSHCAPQSDATSFAPHTRQAWRAVRNLT